MKIKDNSTNKMKEENQNQEKALGTLGFLAMVLNIIGVLLILISALMYALDPTGPKDILLSVVGLFIAGIANCLWLRFYVSRRILVSSVYATFVIVASVVALGLYSTVT